MYSTTLFGGLLAYASGALGTKYFDGSGNPVSAFAPANANNPAAAAPSVGVPNVGAPNPAVPNYAPAYSPSSVAGMPNVGAPGVGAPSVGAPNLGLPSAAVPNVGGALAGGASSIGAAVGNHLPSGTSPAAPIYTHFDCGTHADQASTHFMNTIAALHAQEVNGTTTGGTGSLAGHAGLMVRSPQSAPMADPNIKPVANIVIPMYLHVVSTQANANMVTPAMVQAQFQEMNSAYNPYSISFTLQGTSYSVNDTWATSGDDTGMKTALRKGTYNTLNIYLSTNMANNVLGQCTLPTDVGTSPTPATYVWDGCVVNAASVPGGNCYGYNMGKTAVHETGHWLGLLHTFNGYSCSGPGDYVNDTNSEASSTDGCPTSPAKNTCPGRPGTDPIHNYMDYSTDQCYTRFTPGQVTRMKALWPRYRQGK